MQPKLGDAMDRYLPPLHVHVAFMDTHPRAQAWSQRLFCWLTGDPDVYAVPQANIPMFRWSGSEHAPPRDIAWAEAERTVLLLLIDDELVVSDAWRAWARRQASSKRPGDLLLPCTITGNFGNIGQPFDALHAIRLDRMPEAEREDGLVLLATHAIARWFAHPVCLFLSHAKTPHRGVSGRELADILKSFVQARPAGQVFFDEVGITGGDEFAETLEAALENAVVVVIVTDRFSSRYWCGWEVVTSKEKQRPLLVVNALEEGEPASFAYLGKVRTIRWHASTKESREDPAIHRDIVAGALLELLRNTHEQKRLEVIRALALPGEPVHVSGGPPEIATLPERRPDEKGILLLHPDPPVPRYELTVIQRQRPDVDFASATQALAGCHAGAQPLAGKRIALSISDSPDRESNGLSKEIQERLWTGLATHLLVSGAQLAYGGDLRQGGYTEQLRDLARVAADAGRPLPAATIHWYVGWPISKQLSATDRASFPAACKLHLKEMPAELREDTELPRANDFVPENHFAWTLGMRDLRLAMARDCQARVLVGGQMRAVTPWPGLLEELQTFVGKPIYLVGAFGGATGVIIRALQGESPDELTMAFQDEGGKRTALREYYQAKIGQPGFEDLRPIDWKQWLEELHRLGVAGLDNGLTEDENARLFVSRDLTEVIALVVKGLRTRLGS
jgi:hypothetical protein